MPSSSGGFEDRPEPLTLKSYTPFPIEPYPPVTQTGWTTWGSSIGNGTLFQTSGYIQEIMK